MQHEKSSVGFRATMKSVRWWIAVLGLAACNQAFGTEHVDELDAADLRLLKPPSEPATCPPAPDFASWHMAPRAYPGIAGSVIHPTFLTDDDVLFNYQGRFYEGTLETPPALITELDDDTGAMLYGASAAPGGDMFWYERYSNLGAGLYYAIREGDGWHPHAADFPVTAYSLEPGSAGFYAGEVRMVVAVQPKSEGGWELHELASSDGAAWRDLGMLPFAAPADEGMDPMLTSDGCVLLYSSDQKALWVATRRDDGTFTPPVQFPGTATFDGVHQPAISPSRAMIWFDAPGNGQFQVTP
jgi:hypothetical protein